MVRNNTMTIVIEPDDPRYESLLNLQTEFVRGQLNNCCLQLESQLARVHAYAKHDGTLFTHQTAKTRDHAAGMRFITKEIERLTKKLHDLALTRIDGEPLLFAISV